MNGYSLKHAFGLAAAAIGAEGLIGTGYAVWHHSQGHFETLQQSFAHVVQPETAAVAIALAAVFGAGGALINQYHKTLDREDSRRQRPQGPASPRR